ncbi:hypothetical protein HDF26_002281 [Pedobacter cryoconitis]|uniref:hypothetical protein n=1 Tax=Pedobacter cryoconitis TaxID=188932 RepID=UPI0016204379|nr:hypothetical protein [Pedobacter cryoconitis]MBB6271824.1 hypothetical protein [Pedobacter cryoconitis]
MKFISETPESRYPTFIYNDIVVFLDEHDLIEESIQQSRLFCKKHGYDQNGIKPKAVYYLRGRLKMAEYPLVLKGLLEAEVLPPELREIVHCLSFWNQEGEECFKMNGLPHESYQDFILKCIAADCRAFVDNCPEQFITGMGGSHIWVCDKHTGERILIIHF